MYAMDFLEVTAAIILVFVTLIIYLFLKSRKVIKKRVPPEAPGGWPIIGHLPLLAESKAIHITLGNMADKFGPIFTFRFGVHRTVVVSDSNLARECLTTNDKALANRPKAVAFEILGYNNFMITASPYGEYLRQIRKIVNVEVFSNHRLEMQKKVQEKEMKEAIQGLYQEWIKNKNSSNEVLVELKKWLHLVSLNVIFKIIVGKRYQDYSKSDNDGEYWRDVIKDISVYLGKFVVSDALPFLKWLDLGGDQKAMKKIAKELDSIVKEWLEEHKQNKALGKRNKAEEDFMDALLSILDDERISSKDLDADSINKITCLSLILGGLDTSSHMLNWILALLLNNPQVLKKAQQELDTHVGRERQVTESDTKSLVYLQAVIKESLRLYPPVPLLVPHEAMEDCKIGGYDIQAGTRVMINASKIQRDPEIWPNPSEFQPERFLTTYKDVDVGGQHFELIPFGSGRRMCPAVSFALQMLNLTVAILLHSFDIERSSDELIDMTESAGITNVKVGPIDALLIPRLPGQLY